jgi:hypothetical protein
VKFVAEMKIDVAHVLQSQFGQMKIVGYVKRTLRSVDVWRTIKAPTSITRHSVKLNGKRTMDTTTRTKINEYEIRDLKPDGTIHD